MLFATIPSSLTRRTVAWIVTAVLVGVAQAAPPDDLSGKRYTVEASVQASPGFAVRAEQETGPFTVPKGYRATNFKYHFGDPQSGYESDKLRAGNIRAIRGGFVGLNVGESGFSLGPGDYVFVVGGMPGAMGTLSYTLAKAEGVDGSTSDGERIIDVVVGSPQYPDYKAKATYYVRNGQVRGESKSVTEYPPNEYRDMESAHTNGTYTGTLNGNVITGTWQEITLPHRYHWRGDSHPYDRVDSGKSTYQNRVVLFADGTLSETLKGSGTVVMDWGPTAPKNVAGKRETSSYDFAAPGEKHPSAMTGTWKNRN